MKQKTIEMERHRKNKKEKMKEIEGQRQTIQKE